MKKAKLLSILACGTLLVSGLTGLTSCGNNGEDTTIKIQLVPSRDPGALATLATKIGDLLNKTSDKYTFEITTGTDYSAVAEALVSDQVDAGFLTATSYAGTTLKNEGKVEVLLSAVRSGYQVMFDFDTEEKQRQAMNGEVENYEYLGQQSTQLATSYVSTLVVRNEFYVDKNGDGKIDVLDMAGLTIARQGADSGSGYLRPLKYLADHGMEMVDNITDATKQIKGLQVGGYDAALSGMMDGSVAGYWGYIDVRYANGYSKSSSQWFNDKSIFTSTKCVAITDGIYNDTITTRTNISAEKEKQLKMVS